MTTRKHEVSEELRSSLLANYKKPEDLIGQDRLTWIGGRRDPR